jgi:glycosyltransferase involved in cell wall biosynthesis
VRLGYLCHHHLLASGGPGGRAAGLLSAFARLGHEIHVRADDLPKGLDVVCHPPNDDGLASMTSAIDICFVRLDGKCHAERMAEQMQALRPDLPILLEIHSPLEEQRVYAYSDAEADTPSGREAWITRGNTIRRRLAAMCAGAVCGSANMERYARQALQVGRTLISPNSADPARFSIAPRPEGQFKALWTGTPLYPWQAIDLVVDAARCAPEIGFILSATAPEGVPEDLPPNVQTILNTPSEQMPSLYARIHAALVLYHEVPDSAWEFYGSPLKLHEALAAGVPIVGSNLGEIPIVIGAAGCGIIVAPDPHAVAEALRTLAADPDRARAMGQAARAYAEAHTWDDAVARIIPFCETALQGQCPRP